MSNQKRKDFKLRTFVGALTKELQRNTRRILGLQSAIESETRIIASLIKNKHHNWRALSQQVSQRRQMLKRMLIVNERIQKTLKDERREAQRKITQLRQKAY